MTDRDVNNQGLDEGQGGPYLPDMKIRAIAPWFGGKRNLAPLIIKKLGPHRVYWEPFCGSMAVLMAKEPCRMETVNDLHGDLIDLALILRDEGEAFALYKCLMRTLMHEAIFEEAVERLAEAGPFERKDCPDTERACWFMVYSWLGRNGMIGTASYSNSYCVRYTANGGDAARRWQSVIESIPAWHKRLSKVTILQRDAFEIIDKIHDTAQTAVYIDPPYLKKGAKYIHDFEEADHQRLAEALARFKQARVVVSYYDDPRLAELYPGWTMHRIEVSKAMSNAGSRGAKDVRAVEVLITNELRESAGLFDGGLA